MELELERVNATDVQCLQKNIEHAAPPAVLNSLYYWPINTIKMNWLKRSKRILYLFQHLYEKVTTSIAFYPSLIALLFFLFSGLMIFAERRGITANLEEHLPAILFIKNWGVAQAILTTLIGALISLMVFSFSMVMVLLNNAAANFSPRILPKLISDKFHQFVLGFYLGTITYCLLLTLNLKPSQSDIHLPGLSILLGILLGLACLMLFVFFIHSISESVQVGKILENLHYGALQNIRAITARAEKEWQIEQVGDFDHTYYSDRSGYLKRINYQKLYPIVEAAAVKVEVLIPQSKFAVEGSTLFRCSRKLTEEELTEILGTFVFLSKESAEEDPIIAIKQITEIAIKAMSPGINDPGTALTAIDHLSILFVEMMKLPAVEVVALGAPESEDSAGTLRVWIRIVDFETLLSFVVASVRQYARHDLLVVLKVMEMLLFLSSRKHCQQKHRDGIQEEIKALQYDAKEYLTNPVDYARVEQLAARINAAG